MTDRQNQHSRALTAFAACLAAVLCTAGMGIPARAAPPPAEVPLTWREVGSSYSIAVPLKGRDVVFRKEPEYEGKVVRGAIPVGAEPTDILGFAWDRGANRLHLDANRNLDLTDDAPARSGGGGNRSYAVQFDGLSYEVRSGEAVRRYNFSMMFYTSRLDSVNVHVKSSWNGPVDLSGTTWALTWVDDFDGIFDDGDQLILAPPTGAEPDPGSAHVAASYLLAYRVPCRTELFVDGEGYRFEPVFRRSGEPPGSTTCLKVTEITPETEAVTYRGERVTRLALAGAERTVILNRPVAGTLALPAGDYANGTVMLDGGKPDLCFHAATNGVTVSAGSPTEIVAGGPLNNSASATLHGGHLSLQYRLLGIGDRQYQSYSTARSVKPRVTIYQDEKELHSGSFEYG